MLWFLNTQDGSDDSEFQLEEYEEEEEEESFSDSGAESSDWEESGRGSHRRQRVQQKGVWLESESDSDYRPGRKGGGGRRKTKKQSQNKDHWNE